jgi:hypothetical protein
VTFNPDLMLPPVPEIVFVEEAFIDSKAEIHQLQVVTPGVKVRDYSSTDTVISPANSEPMEVKVAPVKGDL